MYSEVRIGTNYKLGRRIGHGSFGEIYRGVDVLTGTQVAIKVESLFKRNPHLLHESKLYRLLQGVLGVPHIYWYGVEAGYSFLVMDLLGPSVEALFEKNQQKFSLKTSIMLGHQMVTRLELVHTQGIIHRDIKPHNFTIGRCDPDNTVDDTKSIYIIDFGLSKKYRDSRHAHMPFRDGRNLTGTARYVSINTHLGIEPSRRDDLESCLYVVLYLLKSGLPWQGLRAATKKEKYEKIMEKKMDTSVELLCEGLPKEVSECLVYCRSLRFSEKPDYAFIRSKFTAILLRRNLSMDYVFDWHSPSLVISSTSINSNLVARASEGGDNSLALGLTTHGPRSADVDRPAIYPHNGNEGKVAHKLQNQKTSFSKPRMLGGEGYYDAFTNSVIETNQRNSKLLLLGAEEENNCKDQKGQFDKKIEETNPLNSNSQKKDQRNYTKEPAKTIPSIQLNGIKCLKPETAASTQEPQKQTGKLIPRKFSTEPPLKAAHHIEETLIISEELKHQENVMGPMKLHPDLRLAALEKPQQQFELDQLSLNSSTSSHGYYTFQQRQQHKPPTLEQQLSSHHSISIVKESASNVTNNNRSTIDGDGRRQSLKQEQSMSGFTGVNKLTSRLGTSRVSQLSLIKPKLSLSQIEQPLNSAFCDNTPTDTHATIPPPNYERLNVTLKSSLAWSAASAMASYFGLRKRRSGRSFSKSRPSATKAEYSQQFFRIAEMQADITKTAQVHLPENTTYSSESKANAKTKKDMRNNSCGKGIGSVNSIECPSPSLLCRRAQSSDLGTITSSQKNDSRLEGNGKIELIAKSLMACKLLTNSHLKERSNDKQKNILSFTNPVLEGLRNEPNSTELSQNNAKSPLRPVCKTHRQNSNSSDKNDNNKNNQKSVCSLSFYNCPASPSQSRKHSTQITSEALSPHKLPRQTRRSLNSSLLGYIDHTGHNHNDTPQKKKAAKQSIGLS